jgi:hypothetical protein
MSSHMRCGRKAAMAYRDVSLKVTIDDRRDKKYFLGGDRDTPHFWGSTQTFYVVFVPARQKCGVSQNPYPRLRWRTIFWGTFL